MIVGGKVSARRLALPQPLPPAGGELFEFKPLILPLPSRKREGLGEGKPQVIRLNYFLINPISTNRSNR